MFFKKQSYLMTLLPSVGLAITVNLMNFQSVSAKDDLVFEAGHPSLQSWLLPETPPSPAGNEPTAARIELGKKLFFDPRLSGNGSMSCASCHSPLFGWSDGLPTAVGHLDEVLGRASPTVVNTGYNSIQMWDGRARTLEDQAMGPMEAAQEMNMDIKSLFEWLNTSPGYQAAFAAAYPDEAIDSTTLSKALAAFQRTVVSRDSRFDRWVQGDPSAMNADEVEGFRLFVGEAKCVICHSGPNFTDNGFHNIGLLDVNDPAADLGRFVQRPINVLKGAFKTPTIRDIELTAPYFHNGAATTLEAVMDHYNVGGVFTDSVSPNMHVLNLTDEQKSAVVAFMRTLTTPPEPFTLPQLPVE